MESLLPFERIKRTVLVRKDAETSDKFGVNPEVRRTEELINYGIVNIDKPSGPSSHQVSAYVQSILGIDKSGHSGTLDPKVTGVLPIATGRATRVVQTLLTAGKEYVCLMHLHRDIEEQKLRAMMERFTGRIKQLPPVKSAVKRQHRFRNIYYIEILDRIEKDVLFRVGCQAGTYIRKLCFDLGQELGCGAHMAELRRTKAGPFKEDTLCTLQDLSDAFYYCKEEQNDKYIRHLIKPVEFAVQHLPKAYVLDTTVESLCHGAMLAVPGIAKVDSEIQRDETMAVMSLKKELICLGTARMISKEMVAEKSGIAVKTEKVFMLPGTYPRVEKKE